MKYNVTFGADGVGRATFRGGIYEFPLLTRERLADEAPVMTGIWLVSWFSMCSASSHLGLQHMLDATRSFDGTVRLGVHVVDHRDLTDWFCQARQEYSDPVQLLLKHSQLLWQAVGVVGASQLTRTIRELALESQ